MKYVIDTHALIWFLEGNPRLGINAKTILVDPASQLVIPAIVLAEAVWIVERARTSIPSAVDSLSAIDADPMIIIYPLDTSVIEQVLENKGETVKLLTGDRNITASGRKIVIAVPPQYTSQECSSCHRIVKKSLSERTHACKCGCILDRDENASRNLLAKGLEYLSRGGHSRMNAQGHLNLCQISESLLDKFGG